VPGSGLFWRTDEQVTAGELEAFLEGLDDEARLRVVVPAEAGFWGIVAFPPAPPTDG